MPNPFKVFYSWQSELENSTNRNFIQNALQHAISVVAEEVDLEVSIDRDTLGLSGSPDISAAIFQKIEESDAFVCDLSFVNKGATMPDGTECRLTPNANVLVELGYAVKVMGWERIFLIINEHYGPIRELPFDINQRRAKGYKLGRGEDNQQAKQNLQNTTKDAIRAFVALGTREEANLSTRPQLALIHATAAEQNPTGVGYRLKLRLGLKNVGRVGVRLPLLEILEPNQNYWKYNEFGFDGRGYSGLPPQPVISGEHKRRFKGDANAYIHPDEELWVVEYRLEGRGVDLVDMGNASMDYVILADGFKYQGTLTIPLEETIRQLHGRAAAF